METEVKETETQQQEEAQKQWDTERQRADQAESVAEKAREEARQYAEELGETREKLSQMQNQLESFRKETQSKEDALAVMDDTLIDPGVKQNIEKLNARDEAYARKIEEMGKKIQELESERAERVHKNAVAEAREAVLSQCDNEFSPKYRTEALKLADELVDSGKEPQPNDRFSGYLLMKRCYAEVAEKETKKKTSVSVDSGTGGVSHTTKTRKTGTRTEVLADMKKDKSWLTG